MTFISLAISMQYSPCLLKKGYISHGKIKASYFLLKDPLEKVSDISYIPSNFFLHSVITQSNFL